MRQEIAVAWTTADRSMTSWTLASAIMLMPVPRMAIASSWPAKMVYPFVATVREATWNTPGSNSLEILNMFESMIIMPCDDVKVVVRAPAFKAPCIAPAAPFSDCISCTCTVVPNRFFRPCAAHSSTCSAIGDDGVIGKIEAISVKAYDMYAAASFPSIVLKTFSDIINSPLL